MDAPEVEHLCDELGAAPAELRLLSAPAFPGGSRTFVFAKGFGKVLICRVVDGFVRLFSKAFGILGLGHSEVQVRLGPGGLGFCRGFALGSCAGGSLGCQVSELSTRVPLCFGGPFISIWGLGYLGCRGLGVYK